MSIIRAAKIEDADVLTEISFSSKGYWNYPKEYYRIWENELTINLDYLSSNAVWVYENNKDILAYYSLVALKKEIKVGGIAIPCGHWLDHMFIRPSHIGEGIGTELFRHLHKRCLQEKIRKVNILADPCAKGFYQKMGCRYMKEIPSTIAGRTTPHLVLSVVSG